MFSCPRCKLPQEETHQCKYCGLVFEAHARAARTKLALLFFAALIAAGGAFIAYRFLSPNSGPGQLPALNEKTNTRAPVTTDQELKKNARELSGDAGLIGRMTGGLTKGSVVAMVFFSIVGVGYLSYGKKSGQLLVAVCGVALMLYSYFVDGTVIIVLIGVGLCVLPFLVGLLGTRSS